MADKKPAESGDNGLLWTVIAMVFIFFVIGNYVNKYSAKIESQNLELGNTSGDLRLIPVGDLSVGKKITNILDVKVRQSPAGAIIGEQSKRAIGKILEGPVDLYGEKWLRVDYQEIPDGWVSAKDITSKVGFFRALNVFPIFLDIFRPFGLILAIVFLFLIFNISKKQKKADELFKNKRNLEFKSLQRKNKENEIASAPVSLASLGLPSNLPTGDASGLGFSFEVEEQTPTGPKNERWIRVQNLIQSHTSSDWRQAIIEADILLDEMLTRMNYEGDSIGDKLKQIEESDFITLNKAWEAHKIRNHIAHRGGDFTFSKSEAERVINLYRQVFEEFYYI
ncbi:MAG: hypothetical protein KBD10_02875 [Candidatus Pacebacteria bacterium]|nr:hypothetical protein [Candidatus Paceibacterota bacterium]